MKDFKDLVKFSTSAKYIKAVGFFMAGFLALGIVGAIVSSIGVTTETIEQREVIKHEIEKVDYNNLNIGEEKVISEGTDGEKVMVYEVRKKNGQELSRELKSETVTTKPVKRRVLVGTQKPITNEKTAPIVQTPQAPAQPSVSANTGSDTGISTNRSPSSGVKNVVTGYCNDGTLVTGDPSARGKANACYGKGGWRDY